VHPDTCSSVLL